MKVAPVLSGYRVVVLLFLELYDPELVCFVDILLLHFFLFDGSRVIHRRLIWQDFSPLGL